MNLTIIDYFREYGFYVMRGNKFNSESALISYLKTLYNLDEIEIVTDNEGLIQKLLKLKNFSSKNIRRKTQIIHTITTKPYMASSPVGEYNV